MITWLEPTNSGITAVHCVFNDGVVPEAVPAPPVLVDQVTTATPDGSDAVPLNVNEARVVATDVLDG